LSFDSLKGTKDFLEEMGLGMRDLAAQAREAVWKEKGPRRRMERHRRGDKGKEEHIPVALITFQGLYMCHPTHCSQQYPRIGKHISSFHGRRQWLPKVN
jgi:hypothetical protein